jgi:hypothetical protein
MKTCARALLVLGAWAITGLLRADTVSEIQTVSGTVVSSGNISLVIDADDGQRMTLLIDTATSLPPGPLAAGSPVVVRYRPLDSTLWEAVSVARFDAGGAAAAPPLPTEPASSSEDGSPITAMAEPLPVVAALATLAAAFLLLAALRRPTRRAS